MHICTAAEAAGSDRSLPSAAASKQRPDSGASMAGDACFQGFLQGIPQNSYWSLLVYCTDPYRKYWSRAFGITLFYRGYVYSWKRISKCCVSPRFLNFLLHGREMQTCWNLEKRTFLQSTARGIVWSRIFVSANAYYCGTYCISSPLSGFTYTPGTLDDRECHWACCLSSHDCPPPPPVMARACLHFVILLLLLSQNNK